MADTVYTNDTDTEQEWFERFLSDLTCTVKNGIITYSKPFPPMNAPAWLGVSSDGEGVIVAFGKTYIIPQKVGEQ